MKKIVGFASAALASIFAMQAAPALAQEQAETQDIWSVDAELVLVSDYRFRGLSLSDKDPAVQPGLTITHKSGVYAYFWGSTIAENDGADLETDVGIGFTRPLGPVEFDVNANWYLYPGARGVSYVEILTSFSAPVGPATVGVEFAYTPPQRHTGDMSNRYAAITGELPLGKLPLRLTGSFGIEDGAFADKRRDWSLGLYADVAGFEAGASYIDAAHHGGDPLADPTVVVSLRKSF